MEPKVIKDICDLPEILKHRQWDAVVSIGGTCQVAYQIKRLGLRAFSGPFDWLFSTEPDMVTEVLDKDFEGWLLRENLHEEPSQTECRRIIDDKYHMIHQHIFPADRTYEESYDDVKKIVDRRVGRFLSFKEGNKDILFVRTNLTSEEAKMMGEVIERRYGANAYLLVMNHTKDHEVRMLPQVRENVFSFEIFDENENTGQRWQGFDEHWDIVFANISLKGQDVLDLRRDVLFEGVYSYEQDAEGKSFRWATKDVTIDISRFAGKTIKLDLVCPVDNKLEITDDKGKRLAKCAFGKVNPIEKISTGKSRIDARLIDVKLSSDAGKIRLVCKNDWVPSPEDQRKLAMCIRSVTAVSDK